VVCFRTESIDQKHRPQQENEHVLSFMQLLGCLGRENLPVRTSLTLVGLSRNRGARVDVLKAPLFRFDPEHKDGKDLHDQQPDDESDNAAYALRSGTALECIRQKAA